MFSEMGLGLVLMFLVSQSSGLVSSLLLIPLSILFMMAFMSKNYNSSLVLMIYVMVFIGGLLVLLVSVASLSSGEQMINLPKMEFFFLIVTIPFLSMKKEMQMNFNHSLLMLWLESYSFFMMVILMIILIALFIISKNTSNFKGMIRVV